MYNVIWHKIKISKELTDLQVLMWKQVMYKYTYVHIYMSVYTIMCVYLYMDAYMCI